MNAPANSTSFIPAVFLFGDQTDSWIEGIDRVYQRSSTTSWLRSFLSDLTAAVNAEIKANDLDRALSDTLGQFSSLQELGDRYRHDADPLGMARCLLLHTVRAATLLQTVHADPLFLTSSRPECLGISGGLLSLAAFFVSDDFQALYDASLAVGRLIVRLCKFASVQSRAVEDQPGAWGWAILGVTPEELRKALQLFQDTTGIPVAKRAQVGVIGPGWCSIIGPPSVLQLFVKQCPAVKKAPKNPLDIAALQHCVSVSEHDLDYIVGKDSPLLNRSLSPTKRPIWGMDDPNASYSEWRALLRAITEQVLARPLDIPQAVAKLNQALPLVGAYQLIQMGPSSHAQYISKTLTTERRSFSIPQRPQSAVEEFGDQSVLGGSRIAIVGMAGRGPGSDDLSEFWDIVMSQRDMATEVPPDRYDVNEYYCEEHGKSGMRCTMTTRYGCFMNKPGHFDNRFFHISPREAMLMDPGHRQFLMSSYEALEMAGYSNGITKNTDPQRIATFYGQCSDDWHSTAHPYLGCDSYTLQGVQRAFGPGRLAWQLKWEGPTYSLDSACASTTSSIHLACMSLLSKDVDMAVAGAANILSTPHSFTCLSKSGVLSDTGNCKPYRDDADGYCRADFVGSVVLKRLEDAVADNDNILALVAASGRNHSGNSTSITTSDAGAQGRLFDKIMRNAQVSPKDVSYVEMHGTGTQIGDPAEMGAVANLFKGRRPEDGLVNVGGAKANFGHSEAAAGMASLLKCIKMFQEDVIPPQAGMPHALNPSFPPLSDIGIAIPAKALPWPKNQNGVPRRILLNNFDAAGGNACMLLEDYPQSQKTDVDPRNHHVAVTSARTPAAHAANKSRLLDWLRAHPDTAMEDLAYTTTARRLHHPIRSAYIASTIGELIEKLQSDVAAEAPKPIGRHPPVVLAFTGQGSHYAGMGSALYSTSSVFRETVDLCVRLCDKHGFPDFADIITSPATDLSAKSAVQTQLAVIALEIALAAFWKSTGLEVSMVVGHSLGEYAALHVAGVLSLADVLYLVGSRAQLLIERCEEDAYAMLAVNMSADEVKALLQSKKQHSSCTIACMNSPNATVISGPKDDILSIQEEITAKSKVLALPYGFHSYQIDSVLGDFTSLAEGVTYSDPKIPIASTLLGSIVSDGKTFNARYMAQQMRDPVNFVGAVSAATQTLHEPFWLEVGPAPVCSSFVQATTKPINPAKWTVSTLDASRTDGTWKSISKCLAQLYTAGMAVDWLGFHMPYTSALRHLVLPSYAWDVKDFWITFTSAYQDGLPIGVVAAPPTSIQEEMISTCAQYVVYKASDPSKLEVTLRASLADAGLTAITEGHKMAGLPIAPGSVFCEAAFAAALHILKLNDRQKDAEIVRLSLHNPAMTRPLTNQLVGPDGNFDTAVLINNNTPDEINVSWKVTASVSSQRAASYNLGSCTLIVNRNLEGLRASWKRMSYFIKSRIDSIHQMVQSGRGHRFDASIFYMLFGQKVQYDQSFKCVKEAFISDDFLEASAQVVLQDHPEGTKFVASPYWGEAITHLAGFAVNANPANSSPDFSFINSGFESFEQAADLAAGSTYHVYVRVSVNDEENRTCDVFVFDIKDDLIAQCSGLGFHRISNAVLIQALGGNKQARPSPETAASASRQTIEAPKPVAPVARVDADFLDEAVSHAVPDGNVAETILQTIAEETGIALSELSDDTVIAELGVDSIMAIEITSRVAEITGVDLVPSFLTEHPSVADVRRAFDSSVHVPSTASATNVHTRENSRSATPASSAATVNDDEHIAAKGGEVAVTATDLVEKPSVVKIQLQPEVVDDGSPLPNTRTTLLQGRNSKDGLGPLPFYLIADGTGSIATYIHIPAFGSKRPVYGIDSPYLRCPSRLTPDVGIPGIAKLIVEAMVRKHTPGKPFLVGGFSGGAMLAYEVARQLTTAGHEVQGLMLIDMCSPRTTRVDDRSEIGLAMFNAISTQDGSGVWNSTDNTSVHLSRVFASVAAYNPPRGEPAPAKRTALIWARRGLIHRCSESSHLMALLEDADIPTKRYNGYMEDAKFGAVAWSLPDKEEADLGPNGWDQYVGGAENLLCLSTPADHLDMPTPAYAKSLADAMEEGFAHFDAKN